MGVERILLSPVALVIEEIIREVLLLIKYAKICKVLFILIRNGMLSLTIHPNQVSQLG